ncbi:biotin carboxylase, chloroplastic-like [Bidens hawaiensis]|uniref:biotin carboxylase, chloroplastic-like n=1 Tax=Bidens hawaiensis TaxID=980011 RepID=UPI00404A4307
MGGSRARHPKACKDQVWDWHHVFHVFVKAEFVVHKQTESICVMGNKATARETMKNTCVPTVLGSGWLLKSVEEGVRLADESDFLVMTKAGSVAFGK